MSIVLYGNGGARNHGNEAILRGFHSLFPDEKKIVYSFFPETDYQWELDDIYDIREQRSEIKRYGISHVRNYILRHLNMKLKDDCLRFNRFLSEVNSNSIYLLIAGDQYCEPTENGIRSWYQYLNKKIHEKGAKTVMMFCTIPADSLSDNELITDLNRYDLIIARENITYEALKKIGIKTNVIYSPCCAFLMQPKQIDLPNGFLDNRVIGITVGKLAQNKHMYNDKLYNSTIQLIEYILRNTSMDVVLIPHVNGSAPDDICMCKELESFFHNERVFDIGEHRADEQKYVISKCDSIITIRTHVSIAAYSSCVPTVVIGYSQKSKGIARDLFGTEENYVIDLNTACEGQGLINSFIWLQNEKARIKDTLKSGLPNYLSTLYNAKVGIERLCNE